MLFLTCRVSYFLELCPLVGCDVNSIELLGFAALVLNFVGISI